jgi:sulfatase maturation enzyme AslB (radical SAM superfamily)
MQVGNDISFSDFIPKEKMMEIIDDFYDMGVKAITFTGGGEPLFYPYIKETLEKLYFGNIDIKTAFLTNGFFLKDEIAEMIAKNAKWVRVSIDGWDNESYSKYRNVKMGMYDTVIENMEKFNKIKQDCKCAVSMIINKENSMHVYDMITKYKDLGFDSVKASGVIVEDSMEKNNEYHKPIYNVVRLQIYKAIQELSSPDFEIFDAYHELEGTYKKDYTWCPYCQILTVVAAYCNVYSCQDKAYNSNGLIGSIKDQSFKHLWNNGKEKFFRINPSVDCKHHCVQNYKNKNIVEFTDIGHKEFA